MHKTKDLIAILPNEIQTTLDKRGFYLYEWISQEELKQAIMLDYFNIMKNSMFPLFIVSSIFGVIGYFGGGPVASAIAVLSIFGIFYLIVFFVFIVKIFKKGTIYSKFANVVLTDSHMTVGHKIFLQSELDNQKETLDKVEFLFDEKLFQESKLSNKISNGKTDFVSGVQNIFSSVGDFLNGMFDVVGKSNSKGTDQFAIIVTLIVFLVGIAFSITIGISYFLGLPIMYFLTLMLARTSHKMLLLTQKTEYTINNLFTEIQKNSDNLELEVVRNEIFLTEMKNNNWTDNLFGKVNSSFSEINKLALNSTNGSIKLRKILQNSDYKNIFNFNKFDFWLKNQIILPMEKLIAVLDGNIKMIDETIKNLEKQITKTDEISHKKPLELQKYRLEKQIENFDKIKKSLQENIKKIS